MLIFNYPWDVQRSGGLICSCKNILAFQHWNLKEGGRNLRKSQYILWMTVGLWQSFLDDFIEHSFFLNDAWHDSLSLNLYTDAAGSLVYGGIFGSEWFFGAWSDGWKQLNITILEFYPIVLSVVLFGDKMRNQRITFFTNNAAFVYIINKATSRHAIIIVFVRRMVLACLNFSRFFVPVTGFQVQAAGSNGRAIFNDSHPASATTTQLAVFTSNLIQSSLQPSSITTCRRAERLYRKFADTVFHSASIQLPISPSNLGCLSLTCFSVITQLQLPTLMSLHLIIVIALPGCMTRLRFLGWLKCCRVMASLGGLWTVACP